VDSSSPLTVEQTGSVAILTADRSGVLNALDPPLLEALVQGLRGLAADLSVRAAVLAGAGRAFMAGADVRSMVEMAPPDFRRFVEGIQELTRAIRQAPFPVIAAVGGAAVGAGCEIACACDLRVASTEASFGFPEVRLGLVVTSGASYLLPRLVGRGWARYLLFTGETIPAETAYRIGLVQEVTQRAALLDRAIGLALRIAEGERMAATLSKRLLESGEESSLEAALEHEIEAILSCFTEGEAREGLTAFLEKRDPQYRGGGTP